MTKAASPAQIAARKRFAEMARSGAFKRKRAKASRTTIRAAKRKRNPAGDEFFVKTGAAWISGRSRSGGWVTSNSFERAVPLSADDAAAVKSHCDLVRVACHVVPIETIDFEASTPGKLQDNPKARKGKPIKRPSQITRAAPSPRLVKRRRATAKGPRGYFANPIGPYRYMELHSKPARASDVHLFHFTTKESAKAVTCWKLPAALVGSVDFQAWVRGNRAVVSDTRAGMYKRLRRLQGKA